MLYLLIGLCGLAFAEDASSANASSPDLVHPDWEKIRSMSLQACASARSPHDVLSAIEAEQEAGRMAAGMLMQRAGSDLPKTASEIVRLLAANGAPDDDAYRVSAAFDTAESVYLAEATRIAHDAASLEYAKPYYRDERPVRGKQKRAALVDDCADRVVASARFLADAIRVDQEQLAFLKSAVEPIAPSLRASTRTDTDAGRPSPGPSSPLPEPTSAEPAPPVPPPRFGPVP